MLLRTALASILLFSIGTKYCIAIDIVRVENPVSQVDKRTLYKNAIMYRALEITRKDFGAYKLITDGPVLSRERAVAILPEGHLINAYITSTYDELERTATPIRFPIRKGLSSYRLLFIHKDDKQRFENVRTLADLQKFKSVALGHNTTASILLANNIEIQRGTSFNGIFRMLANHRYDFLARGINEIFNEANSDLDAFEHIIIEPNLVIYAPIAIYLFVSPKYPRLVERFTQGLERMRKDGSFDSLFNAHYGDAIRQANISKRTIIRLDNPTLPKSVPLNNKHLWVDFTQP